MKVLMVLTSHDKLGDTGRKTGFWLEELAAPYYEFKDAGAQITLASPKGGRPPLDPKSQDPSFQTDITRRFEKDADAESQLDKTIRLDTAKQEDYDTVFYPGGHGPMWDLAEDPNSIKLIESILGNAAHQIDRGRARADQERQSGRIRRDGEMVRNHGPACSGTCLCASDATAEQAISFCRRHQGDDERVQLSRTADSPAVGF